MNRPHAGVLKGQGLCADVLRIIIWLVPARKENIPLNVPPYLNAETTVLLPINDTGYFQVNVCHNSPSATL